MFRNLAKLPVLSMPAPAFVQDVMPPLWVKVDVIVAVAPAATVTVLAISPVLESFTMVPCVAYTCRA